MAKTGLRYVRDDQGNSPAALSRAFNRLLGAISFDQIVSSFLQDQPEQAHDGRLVLQNKNGFHKPTFSSNLQVLKSYCTTLRCVSIGKHATPIERCTGACRSVFLQ